MLNHLQIENIGIISSLSIEFDKGLNVLTGETGAGKSIIISSFSLLLGERVSPIEIIRKGSDSGKIKGLIYIDENHPVSLFLSKNNITVVDGEILISREINIKGKNKCLINGELVNLSFLKDFGDLLVDIHGAHDHQKLLNPDSHIFYLDKFAGSNNIISEYLKIYNKWVSSKKTLNEYIENEERKKERLEYIKHEINSLIYIDKIQESEEELEKEYEILSNSKEIEDLCISLIDEGIENDESIVKKLNSFKKKIERLSKYDPSFKEQLNELNALNISITDACEKVSSFFSNCKQDYKRLDYLEEIISKIQKDKLKFGKNFEQLKDLYENLKIEKDSILNPQSFSELEKIVNENEKNLSNIASKLSKIRKDSSIKLKMLIEKEFKDLGMPNAEFFVEFKSTTFTINGSDNIEFLLITNPGEPKKPLSKIASGGELSRIMLSFKTILANVDDIPILIFDEIDANIGGVTAVSAAIKMKKVSQDRQVIVITHQPQIAAKADKHFSVSKSSLNNITSTNVSLLANDERINEIARMLGGQDITSVVKKHAKEMLNL